MGKEDVPARRGRLRQRKQNLSVKEVCTAPVIELTSSSEDDEPPPPPSRPALRKSQPAKPPILGKRGPGRPRIRPLQSQQFSKNSTEKDRKKLTDTEALLSILESNDEDDADKETPPASKKTAVGPKHADKAKQDKLMKSIEDELRYLDEVDIKHKPTLSKVDTMTAAKIEKIVDSDESINSKLRKVENVFYNKPNRSREEHGGETKNSDITGDSKIVSERTKLLSPSQIKLPPEVLEAIKKRTDLGRIEKIVEKTDSNQKSKYIVIFNKSGGKTKRKTSIEEEIEELLKSLPEKPSPVKKTKLEDKSRFNRIAQKPPPKGTSIWGSKKMYSGNEDKKQTPAAFEGKKSLSLTDMKKAHLQSSINKKSTTTVEEPVRFTESPLGHEPRLPGDSAGDGFEKYFKVVERLVEHHDSLDSDSEYEEPEIVSHFKSLNSSDQINVNNIADTIAREFPKWNVESLRGTNTICLVRLGLDNRGVMTVRKQIKIDSEYNVSVVVDNSAVSEYGGMYDSFDNIKQLVHEIDAL